MHWILLILAGFLEVGWIISLKYTEGFTKLVPLIFYAFFGFTTAYSLSVAIRTIPLGMAYSIWMGIAVIGTTIAEQYISGQSSNINLGRIFFMLLIIAGITGLKLSGGSES
ncbi:MAG: multidrug transporter [Melioribacteraceae bacterium]|nr:MAG: multidrug transporter [Melioribacteraceae bacterium]